MAFVLALFVVLGFGQLTNNDEVTSVEHWPASDPGRAGRL